MTSITELLPVYLNSSMIEAYSKELKESIQFGDRIDIENDRLSTVKWLIEGIN